MHINKAKCKKFLLRLSEQTRGGKFTRVSKDVYDYLDYAIMNTMKNFVSSHPSVGKTLMSDKKYSDKDNS